MAGLATQGVRPIARGSRVFASSFLGLRVLGSRVLGSSALAVVACVAVAALLTSDHAWKVWETGAFYDTDDAMRAVQLRAWLQGQAWYVLSVARLDPPNGVFMHWSRVVDLPLAALQLVAKPFLGPELAERFARLAFPAICFAALLVATGWTAAVLGGSRARLGSSARLASSARFASILLCFGGAPFLGQFVPGRIDHHAPQIVLLMTMTGALLASFEVRFAAMAGVAGLCAALSLSISLENLPFIALASASVPFAFLVRGATARPVLLWFASVLATALVLLFLATVGPSHRLDGACDALSIAHIAAAFAGCGALALLAIAADKLQTMRARLVAVIACAPLPILAMRFAAPDCLGDPFIGLDPLVRDIWLRHVAEVEPLPSFLRTNPWTALSMLVPLLGGLVSATAGIARAQGLTRARYALVGAMLLMTLAMACWGIRALSSGLPFVAVAAAPWVVWASERYARTKASRLAAAVLAAVPVSPLLLIMLLPPDHANGEGSTLSCVTPEALAPLAALPRGTIVAPIDMGSHLLAFTPHSVFAAPYHRDNAGNRLVLDALMAPPEQARELVETSGADYVAVCANGRQTKIIAERSPDGLAAQLLAGRTPDWLQPLPIASPQVVYRVRPSWALRTTSGD